MRCSVILVALACISSSAHAYDIGLNLYIGSYHSEKIGANGEKNEPANPGLGLRIGDRGFVEAGAYDDSRRNIARYAGVGYQWGNRLRYGGMLVAVHSQSYNLGKAFVAPIPLVSYQFSRNVIANAIYIPKIQNLNNSHVLGFYLTLKF